MERVYNFSAGPSMLPLEVLQQVQQDLINYPGAGSSVMEMSHRSAPFEAIIAETEATLRRIMRIPDSYAVLFLQGGASLQFSMVPMNLAARGETADYALTGQFSTKAFQEAGRWLNAVAVTNSKADTYSYIPKITPDILSPDARYLHICLNNTIFGTCYNTLPEVGDHELVADLSSVILGKEIDVERFSLIYAGAQKNMGPAGLTVVILKKELLEREVDSVVPGMMRYKDLYENQSMINTPPTFSIYVAGEVFKWVELQGGVAAMEKLNRAKAELIYQTLEQSKMFSSPVAIEDRSIMNITFTLPDEDSTKQFLRLTESRGMINLKGHRSVGGCRASMYNAMPLAGAQALAQCIIDFENGIRA